MGNGIIMQVVKPNGVNPEAYKLQDNTYNFPFTVDYTLPMPQYDGYKGVKTTMVDGGRNATGDFEGAVIGQPKDKVDNFYWKGLDGEKGQELMTYFANTANFTFFARYYDVFSGNIITKRFYHGDITCEPHIITTTVVDGVLTTGEIDFYTFIRMNVIEV